MKQRRGTFATLCVLALGRGHEGRDGRHRGRAFYGHGGLDVQGTLRALVRNLAAGGAMAPILQARGSGTFPPADPTVANGNTSPVPACREVARCAGVVAAAGFESTTARVNSSQRAGAFVGTSLGGRSPARW